LTKLIILTGPQGSGNHLFSKILATNSATKGWQALLDEYWIGHDKEPFASYWSNTSLLDEFEWDNNGIYVTSISCPYAFNGTYVNPDYKQFIECASKYADIQLVLISRDQTILSTQQQRVRGLVTLDYFLKNIEYLKKLNPIIASHEALYLYGIVYVNWLEQQLGLPLTTDLDQINNILKTDTNKKYITPVKEYWLDSVAQNASSKWI